MKRTFHGSQRLVLCTLVALVTVAALLGASGRVRWYNSDEHQLIVDRGAALVTVPASVQLPEGVSLAPIGPPAYRDMVRAAKRLAVGFDTNNESDYSERTGAVQDNCFWRGYGQLADNKLMHIPEEASVPDRVLRLPGYTRAEGPGSFTLGQLAALYGDYRRTTHCVGGKCFLTNADVAEVAFDGNVVRKSFFCPAPVRSAQYLQRIGSGLIPPYGTWGNQWANSVGPSAWNQAAWYGDEMIRIANVNDWHFSSGAIAWYTGLHRLALVYVDSARGDPVHWVRALHYEANALHSLTDLFAFGHVVTNRDETSHGIMRDAGLLGNRGYLWMANVIRLGGGSRSGAGRVALSAALPAAADVPSVRNDFVASYRSSWAARAKAEHTYHQEFNKTGAQVRNLHGDDFYIFGDTRLSQMRGTGRSMEVLVEAVRVSLQSLFDAYVALSNGSTTVAELTGAGSSALAALQYVPVYVGRDANTYFTGRWTRYAKVVDELTGSGRVPGDWERCAIPYLSGADWTWPAKSDTPCTSF